MLKADFNLYHLNLLWDSLDKWDTWSNNIFTMDFNKVRVMNLAFLFLYLGVSS